MTRKTLLYLSLLTTGVCFAAPLTPEEALNRVYNNGLETGTRGSASLQPVLIKKTPVGEPSLYVFESNEKRGFMVVSADDAVIPLLGYSDFETIDLDNMPPALENWLNQYSEQIEFIRSEGINTRGDIETRVSLPNWSPIAPLVKTRWNQGTPYNNDCPRVGGINCYTGCVATAMAQVMNYFQYPEKGQGSITYDCRSLGQTLSMDFSKVTFDWANMLNSYNGNYHPVQAKAVSTLMVAAGYSVEMSYTTNQSGAISGFIPGALIKYFNYDKGAFYVSRSDKTYTEWATMIYINLSTVGPVIYDGDTDYSGGHSFVCDGYDRDGYFHFNWGWGGSGDGYFLLDSLNPSSIGIGGALGGFNFRQDAVFNIRKPVSGTQAEQNEIMISGSVQGAASSSYLYFKFYGSQYPGLRYYGATSMTFDIGIKITPADNPNATPVYKVCTNNATFRSTNMPLDPGFVIYCDGEPGYPFPMYALNMLGLTEGVKYKITGAYHPDNGEWLDMPVGVGCYNYFYVTRKGSSYVFENMEQMQFTCNSLTPLSDFYNGSAVKMSISLSNKNNTELTRGVTMQLLDSRDNIAFIGDSFVETLSPNETINKEWITNLRRQDGVTVNTATNFYLALFDIDTQTYYYKSTTPITMQPSLGAPSYTCTLKIDNGELLDYPLNIDVYQVENAQDIEVSVDVDVTKGLFSYPVYVYGGYEDNGNVRFPSMTYPLDIQIIDAGEEGVYNVKVNYSDAEVDKMYFLIARVDNGTPLSGQVDDIIGFIALSNEAGISQLPSGDGNIRMIYDRVGQKLVVEGGISVEIYSLNGMKLSSQVSYMGENAEVDLTSLGKGVVIVNATDKEGNHKSVKLAL